MVFFPPRFNIRHKNIALRAQGLDEAAAVGLFAEGAADLADVYVDDPVVGHVFAFQHARQVFAGQRLERLLKKSDK